MTEWTALRRRCLAHAGIVPSLCLVAFCLGCGATSATGPASEVPASPEAEPIEPANSVEVFVPGVVEPSADEICSDWLQSFGLGEDVPVADDFAMRRVDSRGVETGWVDLMPVTEVPGGVTVSFEARNALFVGGDTQNVLCNGSLVAKRRQSERDDPEYYSIWDVRYDVALELSGEPLAADRLSALLASKRFEEVTPDESSWREQYTVERRLTRCVARDEPSDDVAEPGHAVCHMRYDVASEEPRIVHDLVLLDPNRFVVQTLRVTEEKIDPDLARAIAEGDTSESSPIALEVQNLRLADLGFDAPVVLYELLEQSREERVGCMQIEREVRLRGVLWAHADEMRPILDVRLVDEWRAEGEDYTGKSCAGEEYVELRPEIVEVDDGISEVHLVAIRSNTSYPREGERIVHRYDGDTYELVDR